MRQLSLLALTVCGALSVFAMFDTTIGIAAKTLIAASLFAVVALTLAILSRREAQPGSTPHNH